MITVCTINHIYFFDLLLPARRTRLNFYTDGRDEWERILFKKDRRSTVRTRLIVFNVTSTISRYGDGICGVKLSLRQGQNISFRHGHGPQLSGVKQKFWIIPRTIRRKF